MAALPEIDLASPLQFVINAAAGSSDAEAKREVIESALRAGGRRGDLLFCSPAELNGVAQQAETQAIANRTAVVAVGGDGTPPSRPGRDYATHLLEGGVNPRIIQRYMGHSQLETTMVYFHLAQKGTEDASTIINSAMQGFDYDNNT